MSTLNASSAFATSSTQHAVTNELATVTPPPPTRRRRSPHPPHQRRRPGFSADTVEHAVGGLHNAITLNSHESFGCRNTRKSVKVQLRIPMTTTARTTVSRRPSFRGSAVNAQQVEAVDRMHPVPINVTTMN